MPGHSACPTASREPSMTTTSLHRRRIRSRERLRDLCCACGQDQHIVDMFAIGLQPTGSKDPFALRRAGNGVIRIIVEDGSLNDRLRLSYVCYEACRIRSRTRMTLTYAASIYEFLLDRFEFYLRRDKKDKSAGGSTRYGRLACFR